MLYISVILRAFLVISVLLVPFVKNMQLSPIVFGLI